MNNIIIICIILRTAYPRLRRTIVSLSDIIFVQHRHFPTSTYFVHDCQMADVIIDPLKLGVINSYELQNIWNYFVNNAIVIKIVNIFIFSVSCREKRIYFSFPICIWIAKYISITHVMTINMTCVIRVRSSV